MFVLMLNAYFCDEWTFWLENLFAKLKLIIFSYKKPTEKFYFTGHYIYIEE